MRNIVLGSEGFIGKYLCNYLENLDEEVAGLDIKNTINEDLRFHRLDLTDIDRVYFMAWDVGGG